MNKKEFGFPFSIPKTMKDIEMLSPPGNAPKLLGKRESHDSDHAKIAGRWSER